MLTDPGDLVVDIFAGSNTTGMVAEAEGRRWLAFELSREYVAASVLRFVPKGLSVGKDERRSIRTFFMANLYSLKMRRAFNSAFSPFSTLSEARSDVRDDWR